VRSRPLSAVSTRRPNRFTNTTPPTPKTRAPIVITIAAPSRRPAEVDAFSKSTQSSVDPLLDSSDVDDEPVVTRNHNGNVVEIDADGNVYCYDVGNFPYPDDCRKYVQCARLRNQPIRGWVHNCPKSLSFDPIGASCNWGSPLRCQKSS